MKRARLPGVRSNVRQMAELKIYFNPKCGTARNTLALIREAGFEPDIIDYMKNPPGRAELAGLAKLVGGASVLLREKEPLAAELGLKGAADDIILDAIAKNPILLNRPVVVTPKGAKPCRPAELVKDLL